MSPEEKLDVEGAIEKINAALALRYRSALQYTPTSGSLFGFEFQSLGDRLWEYGRTELDDARMLVEKVVALGGTPRRRWRSCAGAASPAKRCNG